MDEKKCDWEVSVDETRMSGSTESEDEIRPSKSVQEVSEVLSFQTRSQPVVFYQSEVSGGMDRVDNLREENHR